MRRQDHLDEETLKVMIRSGGTGVPVPVRYWPVWNPQDQDSYEDTETGDGDPWMTGSGEWVVKLKGHGGSFAVSHCRLLFDPHIDEKGPAHEDGWM